jgi:opacity protein-like surface antigen
MRNIVLAALLTTFFAITAEAADQLTHVGLDFSTNSTLGIHGEFDISARADNAPVSAQVFIKNYAYSDSPAITWNSTGLGAVAIYDFNTKYQLDKKIHPYAGIGLMYVHHNWTGIGTEIEYTGVDSGLYVTGGVRYSLTPQVAADFNYNNFGNWTFGINLNI